MTAKREFNPAIHAFRGFAILNIVAIHAFGFVFFLAESMESPAESALRFEISFPSSVRSQPVTGATVRIFHG